VLATSNFGNQLTVLTTKIALTAGAIETTRILLLLNRSKGKELFHKNSPLGLNFHDHLSAPIATLNVKNKKKLIRNFGFQFCSGGMRNLRFELSPQTRKRLGLPGAFLHVTFTRSGEVGFDGLRRIYQSMQKGSIPKLSDLITIAKDFPWLVRAVWWRLFEKRVLPPNGSVFELHMVIEQKPSARNRISLSDEAIDYFGQSVGCINWGVSKLDKDYFSKISNLAIDEWNKGSLSQLAKAVPLSSDQILSHLVEGGGIFHPAGSTRIGLNEEEGVVDPKLRVFGITGLWAISTAIFPSVGGSSPSFSLLQFALCAADDIKSSFGQL